MALLSGATQKRLPYHQETASSNLEDATAIRGRKPRERNWICSLAGRDAILSLSPRSIRGTLTSYRRMGAHLCVRGQIALSLAVTLPCDIVWAAVQKYVVWLHVSRMKHMVAFTLLAWPLSFNNRRTEHGFMIKLILHEPYFGVHYSCSYLVISKQPVF